MARALLAFFALCANWVLGALLAVGCGPSVLWRARSDDRHYEVRIEAHEGGERVIEDGRPHERFDRVLVSHLVMPQDGAAYVAENGRQAFVITPRGRFGPFDEVGELVALGGDVAFALREEGRARLVLVRGGELHRVGPDFDAILPRSVALGSRGLAFVGTLGDAERLVWADARTPESAVTSEPVDGVRSVVLTDSGLIAVLREDGAERVVELDETFVPLTAGWEEVLEPNVLPNGAFTFLGARADDVVVVHRPPGAGPAGLRTLFAAPVITHLRISDDGAHVAYLVPAENGESIALYRDDAVLAIHRRIEGERLAFVPETSALVWVAEDNQAPRVLVDGVASDRYAEIEGPVTSPGRIGFVGRGPIGRGDGAGSDVVIFSVGSASMEIEAHAPWAGMLRLARTGHAYVSRTGGARTVVTSHGHWPVPRFFVDTLVLDPTGDHWAALVPDASEREISVWIDGEPRTLVDLEEVAGRVTQSGGLRDATTVLLELARAEMARYLE